MFVVNKKCVLGLLARSPCCSSVDPGETRIVLSLLVVGAGTMGTFTDLLASIAVDLPVVHYTSLAQVLVLTVLVTLATWVSC